MKKPFSMIWLRSQPSLVTAKKPMDFLHVMHDVLVLIGNEDA